MKFIWEKGRLTKFSYKSISSFSEKPTWQIKKFDDIEHVKKNKMGGAICTFKDGEVMVFGKIEGSDLLKVWDK